MFCVTNLNAAILNDVSYSVKQNGVMVNIDYDVPIDDDDIIGWKSDRGWVYLTLLGVRTPKNKSATTNFKGTVRKIVIDDFDESTQLAILLNKPILGYDIINSKGTPGTIVFIHTEMKKSEVAYLKEHINREGTSVFNRAKTSGFPKYNTNFKYAFDKARNELGPNAIFEYNGNLYTTNHPGEKESITKSILKSDSIFDKKEIQSVESFDAFEDQLKEVYVESSSGDTITELILDTLINQSNQKKFYALEETEKLLSEKLNQEDDGWFSGIFPSYGKSKSPLKESKNKEKIIIKNNEPILVEKRNLKEKITFWKKLFSASKNEDHLANKVEEKKISEETPDKKDLTVLQNKYIPPKIQNIEMNLTDEDYKVLSQTQLSDTNNVVIDLPLNKVATESEYNKFKYLQEKYIPLPMENITGDTVESMYFSGSSTQPPDTNIVEAWFTNESIIPNEYDPRYLQQQYIPKGKKDRKFDSLSDIKIEEAYPQTPEYTAPFILDDRYRAQYKNKSKVNRPKRQVEEPFDPIEKEENTWLSFFPKPSDSIKKALNWYHKKEDEVPKFLKRETESLDYSSNENMQYSWRSQLPDKRPNSFPPRYSDPGFRYYRQGGIKIEANLNGVPIYVDGKYVGDTPLARPIEVEPGWHQVSGFSPVYTKLAARKGLQFVGYDSIIQNNEMYGSTTVYAEAGKLENVSLKFNQMGDVPKRMRETKGGMSMGIPMFTLLIGLTIWGM